MTVYLDVVFFENFIMNYIILFATAVINKVEIKIIRISISSVLGSVYAIMHYTYIFQNYIGTIMKIMLSIVMVYIAFKPENIKKMLKQLLIFYLTSFTFGGVAFALLYFIKPSSLLMKNGIYIGTYPIKIALLGGCIGFIIITIAFKIIKGKLMPKDMLYEIEIEIKNKKEELIAMLDTGNLLKEPITNTPVIIVEKKKLKNVIPIQILTNVDSIIKGNIDENMQIEDYINRFRIIPFNSLGKQNGLLLGIKVDKIRIRHNEENESIRFNVIIGIYDGILSKNNNYNALIGLDMIEEGSVSYEYFGNAKV